MKSIEIILIETDFSLTNLVIPIGNKNQLIFIISNTKIIFKSYKTDLNSFFLLHLFLLKKQFIIFLQFSIYKTCHHFLPKTIVIRKREHPKTHVEKLLKLTIEFWWENLKVFFNKQDLKRSFQKKIEKRKIFYDKDNALFVFWCQMSNKTRVQNISLQITIICVFLWFFVLLSASIT